MRGERARRDGAVPDTRRRAGGAALVAALAVGGWASPAAGMEVNSNLWLGPELTVRPGSPIVFVKHWRLVAKGRITEGWFGPKNTVTMAVPDATYVALDIRTCAQTQARRFAGRPTEFSWGAPPDYLWVYAPDAGGAVEPVGGGLRIDIGVELGGPSSWTDRPNDGDVGIGWRRATGLRIWDLGRRAVANVPLPAGIGVSAVVSPQRGDRTLLAVAGREGASRSDGLDILAVAPPDPRAPAPVARMVHVPASRRAGVSASRSVAGGTRLALMSGGASTREGSELTVVDTTGGSAGYRVDLGHDPWAWTRSGPARLVRVSSPTDPTLPPAREPSCRSRATIMDLESGRSRAIDLPTCASTIEILDDAPYAILHLATAYQGTGRLLLDLERATLTSLPETGGTPHVMGGSVYFAYPTRILAMDLAAPTRMRVAVTGLENLRGVWVEPSSQRLVMVDLDSVLVFDAAKGRVTRCL